MRSVGPHNEDASSLCSVKRWPACRRAWNNYCSPGWILVVAEACINYRCRLLFDYLVKRNPIGFCASASRRQRSIALSIIFVSIRISMMPNQPLHVIARRLAPHERQR